ncbi:prohibitin family protein [Pedobacter changchengzhani]|uniref:Prohibitin family protein n=1 Tax=Pedobacter changchengzhani TaxID=2529274 RepID=A0A4R5MIS4_9SPHI|nr:prohibitin family protein [Pedobacter changchengzhani]TDG35494.1 prohibitin family protein [Pedobacter changchengzhani]
MFLGIIGIIIIIVGFVFSAPSNPASRYSSAIKIFGGVIVLVGVSLSMFKVIDAGEVGVKTVFGKVDNDVLYSGLNIINPVADVTPFDVKTQNYTMAGVTDEGNKQGDDALRVLSADGLEVVIDLSVLFRVKASSAPVILKEIGTDYLEKIVRPVSRTAIRDNAVSYDAVALYSSKRDEFQSKIFSTIEKSFAKRGLELEQLLIRNITLPASVKASIESKINAEQDAQKMTFVLQKERQEAERKRVEAQGIADYQKILSTGLSDRQLQYESILAQKEIAKSANTKVIIMGNGKSAPIILGNN